jgi:pre-mRNA-processing factor 17
MQLKQMLVKPSDKQLSYNITYADLTRPLVGPANPFKTGLQVQKNVLTGNAEPQEFSEAAFRTQSRTFQALGYAQNPSLHISGGPEFIGDVAKAKEMGGQNIVEIAVKKKESAALRKTRQKKGDASILDGENAYKGPWAAYKVDKTPSPEPEELLSGEEYEEDSLQPTIYESKTVDDTSHEKTEFNGSEEYDYMGRSKIMHVPQDLDVNLLGEPGEAECFTPKKLIHTWPGHHKGITCIRLFPKSGHMLLSAGNDNKIKVLSISIPGLLSLDMGCIPRSPIDANVFRTFQSCSRSLIPTSHRRYLFIGCIRSYGQTMGHRNWKSYFQMGYRSITLLYKIQSHRGTPA